jgi:hypothetical protein
MHFYHFLRWVKKDSNQLVPYLCKYLPVNPLLQVTSRGIKKEFFKKNPVPFDIKSVEASIYRTVSWPLLPLRKCMHVACFVAAPQAEGLDVSFSLLPVLGQTSLGLKDISPILFPSRFDRGLIM